MFTKKIRMISMIATICMIISSMAVFCLPAAALNYAPIQDVGAGSEATEDDYLVSNYNDWTYLCDNVESFRKSNITIHLGADIDLSGSKFKGFTNPGFSLDGHGYTIKNWGTKEAPISTRAMFQVVEDITGSASTTGGMEFIKNVKFENCHTKGTTTSSALVYAVGCNNPGFSGLPTNFTLDNITFERCTAAAGGEYEAVGMLLSRYAVSDASCVVNISNISIKDSVLTAGKDHAGFIVGKIHNGTQGTTYKISNCLLAGNTLNTAKTTYGMDNGLVAGSIESGSATIQNIAMVGNTIDVTKYVDKVSSLIGREGGATTSLKGIAAIGNRVVVTAKSSGSNEVLTTEIEDAMYLLDGGAKTTGSKLYSDIPLVAVAAGNANLTLDAAASKDIAGEAAWALSKTASGTTDFYWTIDKSGTLVKAKSQAESMRRVDFRAKGSIFQTKFVEGGQDVYLFVEGDDNAKFYLGGQKKTGIYNVALTDGDLIFDVEVDETVVARYKLRTLLKFYEGKNLQYYAAGLAEKLAEAEAAAKDNSGASLAALQLLAKELSEWGYVDPADLPSIMDMDEYPGYPGYVLKTAEELLYAKTREENFKKDQTLYLVADIDLAGKDFEGFGSAACFKFDGMNHTIKNWTKELSIEENDQTIAFFNSSATNSIKNVVFENVKLGAISDSAIVYGGKKEAMAPADRLVIENVHVKNSQLVAAGSRNSIFVSNVQTARINGFAVTGCSIVDTKIEAQSACNNIGGFIGNVDGASAAIEVLNCYASNFDITGAGDQISIFCGRLVKQGDGCSVHVENCVALDCDIDADGDIVLIASRQNGGGLFTKNVVIAHCNLDSAGNGAVKYNYDNFEGDGKGTGKYVLLGNIDYFSGIYDNSGLENLYMIPEEWPDACWANTNSEQAGKTISYTAITEEDLASGELAYRLNKDSGIAYWAMKNGKIVLATEENMPVVKVEVQSEDGLVLDSYYANANGAIIFDIPGAKSYEIAAGSTGTLDQNILKLSGDGADVAVKVALDAQGAKFVYVAQVKKYLEFFGSFRQYGATFPAWLESLLANNNMTIDTDEEVLMQTVAELEELAKGKEYSPVTTDVSNYPDAKAYSVWNKEQWIYLSSNHSKFNRDGVVIYFGADIDMTGATGFTTMSNSKIAIDGLNHKIHDWNQTWNDGAYDKRYSAAIFSGNYQGSSVKNLTFENCTFAGGYSRSVLFCEYEGGSLTIDNVDMINVTLNANCSASHNQMGLYISRTNVNSGNVTIRNCMVKDSKLVNSCGANINNCGLVIGCIKGTYNTLLENVDIINSENNTATFSGGMAIGSFESRATLTFRNVGIFGGKMTTANVPYASIFTGFACITPSVTFTDCMSKGVASTATKTWINTDTSQAQPGTISASNCYSDFGGGVKAIHNSTGVETPSASRADLTGVSSFGSAFEAQKYDLAYRLNRHVSDEAGKYMPLRAMEGYGKVYKVTFCDDYSGVKETIATAYTKANGKLQASATNVLNDARYDWKLNGAEVTANTVFTADTEVFSAAVHDFEGAALTRLTGGKHKAVCNHCGEEFTMNCVGATFAPTATGLQHTPACQCGNTLATEECSFKYTHVAGTNTHTGECEACGRERNARACTFKSEGYYENESDKPTTEKTGVITYACGNDCGNKKSEIAPKLAFAKVVVEGDSLVTFGESFEIKLALKENQAPGLSGMEAIVHYDAAAMTIADPATDVEFNNAFLGACANEPGKLKIMIAAGTPVTEAVVFATIKFTATSNVAREGDYGVNIEVKKATVSGVDVNDPTSLPLGMTTESKTVNVAASVWGDVNRDSNVALSDVVLIMRATADANAMAAIDKGAALINDGAVIDTADAVTLLRYVLGA